MCLGVCAHVCAHVCAQAFKITFGKIPICDISHQKLVYHTVMPSVLVQRPYSLHV